MIKKIASEDRGLTQNSWLTSRHTFAFGGYHNLSMLNFGTLRVFNDDIVQAGQGFATHSHDNMEIVTIVLEGTLEHKDSTGTHGIIKPGDVQRMTAGIGIKHSEFNPSQDEKVRLLQIWIYPDRRDLEPGYEQKTFNPEDFRNRLYPIVTPDKSQQSVFIHQDARCYLGHLDEGVTVKHTPRPEKHGDYVFVIKGSVELGDVTLKAGDSAQITNGDAFELKAKEASKVLLIEVNVNTL